GGPFFMAPEPFNAYAKYLGNIAPLLIGKFSMRLATDGVPEPLCFYTRFMRNPVGLHTDFLTRYGNLRCWVSRHVLYVAGIKISIKLY
ncbi:MAG: hypothetical protein EBZ48_09050, partial [Proteobacteria bacterium]|nr:hypothetical protein [Pseudomonadota bacterium]